MSFSLTRGRHLDVGRIGVSNDDLPPHDQGPLDLRRWFDPHLMQNPLELEIGSGKGTFLVQQAQRTPKVNYIGLEYAAGFWRYAADRCRRHGLMNVRLVRAEAGFFLRNFVPDASFRIVHIYFPDPWPKNRHHKRRLIQEATLRQMHRILKSGGLVRIATDHAEYFDWIVQHAAVVSHLFERLPFDNARSASPDELVGTNFERKYRREGRSLHALVLRKTTEVGL